MDVAEPVTQVAVAEKRALLLAFAVFGSFWGSWAALVPAIQDQTGLDDSALGLCLAAIAVTALPAMPLAGRLVDRVGAARLVRLSLLAFGLAVPITALAQGPGLLVLAFVLLGITTGVLDVFVNVAAAAWERIEAGRLMALCHALFSAGMLVGAVATGFARDAGADPVHVLPVVGLLVLGAAAAQPVYRQVASEPAASGRQPLPRILLAIGLLVAASFLVEDAMQSWSALHLERELGAPPWVGGLGPGIFAAAMTLGRLATHVLGARYRETVLVAGGGACVAFGAVLLAAAPSPTPGLVGLFVAGAGTSVLAPTLFSAVGARSQAGRQGADLATVSMLGYVGFLAGPPVVGLISGASSLPTALGLLGVIGLLLAVTGPAILRAPVRAAQLRS